MGKTPWLAFAISLVATNLQAHILKTGQIIRVQAPFIAQRAAFESEGVLLHTYGRSNVRLEWYGPGNYFISIDQIPSQYYSAGDINTSWRIRRSPQKGCELQVHRFSVSCPYISPWAALEFSGSSSTIAESLVRSKIYSREDAVFQETNSQDPWEASPRANLALSNINKSIAVHVEVAGPDAKPGFDNLLFPAIRFDQTYYSPAQLRIREDEDEYIINGQFVLEAAERPTRYQDILNSRIQLNVGEKTVWTMVRKTPKPRPSGARPAPEPGKTLSGLDSVLQTLSPEGVQALRGLLLTH